MTASVNTADRLLRLRRFNLITCCFGAAVLGWIAAGPSWAGTLFACWSGLPLLIGAPAALTASKSSQQWAIAGVTAISFGAGVLVALELSRSVDAFTPLVAWALPGFHIAGTLCLLTLALTATNWLRWRSATD